MMRYKKVRRLAVKDGQAITLERAVTIAAYLLEPLSPEELRTLNKRVPITRKPPGRPVDAKR